MVCSNTAGEKKLTPQDTAVSMRFCFGKLGRLKYISHLDVNRTLQRALTRAALPLRYTEGFNPHPRMVFALPLAVGVESTCEYLDVSFAEPIDAGEAMVRLNRELPEEMQISEIYAPVFPFKKIGWASYELTLWGAFEKDFPDKLASLLKSSPLIVTKRTKSGEKETDIAPFIRIAAVTEDIAEDGGQLVRISARLCADNTNFLNPIYLVRAAEKYLNLCPDDAAKQNAGSSVLNFMNIRRSGVLLEDGVTVFH